MIGRRRWFGGIEKTVYDLKREEFQSRGCLEVLEGETHFFQPWGGRVELVGTCSKSISWGERINFDSSRLFQALHRLSDRHLSSVAQPGKTCKWNVTTFLYVFLQLSLKTNFNESCSRRLKGLQCNVYTNTLRPAELHTLADSCHCSCSLEPCSSRHAVLWWLNVRFQWAECTSPVSRMISLTHRALPDSNHSCEEVKCNVRASHWMMRCSMHH